MNGTELVSGPSEVSVGERATEHVVLTANKDVGCDPGFSYTWPKMTGGKVWEGTEVGDTVRAWIVNADEKLPFIEGDTHQDTGSEVETDPAVSRVDSLRVGSGAATSVFCFVQRVGSVAKTVGLGGVTDVRRGSTVPSISMGVPAGHWAERSPICCDESWDGVNES